MNEYTLYRIYKNGYGDQMLSTYWLFLTNDLLIYNHGYDHKWYFEEYEQNTPKLSEDLFE